MKNFYNFYRGLKALKTLANKLEVDPSLYGEENLAVERQLEFLIKNHPQLKNRVVFKIEITDDGREAIRYYELDGTPVLYVGVQSPNSHHSGYFYGFKLMTHKNNYTLKDLGVE